MWFTSRPMTRGRFTDIPSWRGRDGTRIPESGLEARISHSGLVSESGGSAVLDGDGIIGDSTGITTLCCLTTAGISPGAPRFTTGAISIAVERLAAELQTAPEPGPGPSAETERA